MSVSLVAAFGIGLSIGRYLVPANDYHARYTESFDQCHMSLQLLRLPKVNFRRSTFGQYLISFSFLHDEASKTKLGPAEQAALDRLVGGTLTYLEQNLAETHISQIGLRRTLTVFDRVLSSPQDRARFSAITNHFGFSRDSVQDVHLPPIRATASDI